VTQQKDGKVLMIVNSNLNGSIIWGFFEMGKRRGAAASKQWGIHALYVPASWQLTLPCAA